MFLEQGDQDLNCDGIKVTVKSDVSILILKYLLIFLLTELEATKPGAEPITFTP